MPVGRQQDSSTRASRNTMTDEQIRNIVKQMYDDGKGQNAMMKRCHCRGAKITAAYDYWRSQGFQMRKSGEPFNPVWSKIIEAVRDNLSWFTSRGIKPTVRAMFYRLYSLGLLPNTHNAYVSLSEETAIARRGYEWDDIKGWKKCTKYVKLDIECFVDESRWSLGEYKDSEAEAQPPPDEYIDDRIGWLKEAPDDYEEEKGTEPGRWYNQKCYVEVWVEKQTLGPTFESFLKDKDVKIVPNKGNVSVSFFHKNCMRLLQKQREGKEIKILYFGDMDPSGDCMDETMKRDLGLYGLDPEIFERVAVTQEQLADKIYEKIVTDPDDETLFKLLGGKDSKGKYKKGDPRTPDYIGKYSKYIKPGHELPPVTEVEAFLAYYPDEFEKLVKDSVDDEYWDEDVYNDAMKEYESKIIDPSDYWDDRTEETVRDMMYRKITEAFPSGWENEFK